MHKQVRVNIKSAANAKDVRREKRNGRDVMIVPSATLPDDIIMNGIKYPADEIGKSFETLNRTPAPLGHPIVNGAFVSARDPEGINLGWIGAWNENARRENGRVHLDKIIDIERANQSDGGKSVIAAINAGGPIHTSTGLLCELEPAGDEDGYESIARNMMFDHDAILVGEEGAATPDQGVGMMVNAKGDKIEVINSQIDDEADYLMDRAAELALRAMEAREKAPLLERMKAALLDVFGTRSEPSTTEGSMDMDKEQFDALSAKVNGLAENAVTKQDLTNALAEAVKPLIDAQEELKANQKAKDDAELAELQAKIVKANLLGEAEAKELTLNAARALAKKADPGKATALNAGFNGTAGADEWAGYDLNASIDGDKGKGAH